MVDAVTLSHAVLAIVPAAALFFLVYGRYDGAFADNVVFLWFLGGLLAGGFLGFMSLLFFSGLTALAGILAVGMMVPLVMVAALNRRKWQGERHAVFNGGALGIGVAVMVSLSLLYFHGSAMEAEAVAFVNATPLDDGTYAPEDAQAISDHFRSRALSASVLGQHLLLAGGLAGLFFGLGLLAGEGVKRKAQFRVAFLGMATFLAPAIFLEELFHAWQRHLGGEWLWSALLLAYGLVYAFAAERKLFAGAVSDDMRRKRRRVQRAKA